MLFTNRDNYFKIKLPGLVWEDQARLSLGVYIPLLSLNQFSHLEIK